MDCLSIITSRGTNMTTISNPGINVGCKMSQPLGFHMETSEEHQLLAGCHPSQNGFHGHANGFGTTGAKMLNPLFQNGACGSGAFQQNGFHPGHPQINGRYHVGMMTGNGFNIPCSAPFGSRKRSLDDEDQDEFKRQRISGGYEANMTLCSQELRGGYPMANAPQQQTMLPMDPRWCGPVYNSSAMEHHTTMAVAEGYDEMYLHNLIAEMHGS